MSPPFGESRNLAGEEREGGGAIGSGERGSGTGLYTGVYVQKQTGNIFHGVHIRYSTGRCRVIEYVAFICGRGWCIARLSLSLSLSLSLFSHRYCHRWPWKKGKEGAKSGGREREREGEIG